MLFRSRLLVYYNDGTSSQWVDASPSDYTSGLAYNTANAAFGKANNAIANTSGVSTAGDLRVSGNLGVTASSLNLSSSGNALTIDTPSSSGYSALEFASGGTLRAYINATNGAFYISSQSTNPTVFYTNGAERMRVDSSGRVTKPYQPLIYARRTGGTWTNYNTGSNYIFNTDRKSTRLNSSH